MPALLDRDELTGLVARLTRWLDDPSFAGEGLRAVYADDVVVHSPRGITRGIDDVLEYVRRTSPAEECTQHFTTDVLVELDGDSAEVTANLLVYFFRPDQPPHRTAGLRYTFDAVRTPDGWRFARAEVAPLWLDERP